MFKSTFWITLALICSLLWKTAPAGEPFTRTPHKPVINAVKSPRNGAVLYDQLMPLAWGNMVSHELTDPANAAYTSFAADDFIVPAGDSWQVSYVNIAGSYNMYVGSRITAVNVIFYADNNGMPGTELFNIQDITSFNELLLDSETALYLYEITLPSAVTLAAGHYWMCVQGVSNYTLTGDWGWFTHEALVIENQYHWKNPEDGYGYGNIDWTPASLISWGSQNLAFALYGPGMEGDLSAGSLIQPVSGPGLTSAQTITVNVKNEGPAPLTGFQMGYRINGGSVVTENVGSFTLNPNQTLPYSFATQANLSAAGPYTIEAFANSATDPNHANDTSTVDIYNFGTVYPMVSTGTQTITACGATFTDAGGLYGPIGMNDNAVTTIYPANPGDRVKLTFLEFNGSYGGFSVYNGTDENAPLMGTWTGSNSPGELLALNNAGALTIKFMGPGWEQTSGWVAFISCVTPLADEFAVNTFTANLATVFQGNTLMLKTNIQNLGTQAFDKAVNFTANGTTIGTVNTGMLNPYDTISVSLQWAASTPGNYTFAATLPADGDLTNNSLTLQRTVLAFDAFFEDFEGPEFPPANWYHGGFWSKNTGPASGTYCATGFISSTQHDTLVTCRVDLGNSPIVNFYARTTMWWVGNLDLYFFSETTNTWNYIQNIAPLPSMNYGNFQADLSAFAGQTGRLGFFVNVNNPNYWNGSVSIDLITAQNITVHFDDYDLMARNIEGEQYYTTSRPAEFMVKVKNNGQMTVDAETYRVALIQDNGGSGIEVFSLPGETIAPGQEISYPLSYAFNEIGEFAVYGKVFFDNDAYTANNVSNMFYVNGVADSSEVVVVGDQLSVSETPMIFYFNHSLTESLYPSEQIGEAGVIFGMKYKFYFGSDETNIPVKIWMGTTTMEELNEWVPAGQLTLVYDGTLDFIKDKGSVYIPFHTPFNYADTTQNLVIMVQKSADHTSNDQYFYNYTPNILSSIMLGDNNTPPDPYAPVPGGQSNMNPSIDLVFNQNIGSASGNVHDIAQAPLADVKVWVKPLNITVYTDDAGNYNLPYVPAGNFNTTADLFGYQPNVQNLGINAGSNTVLDFQMLALGLVSVTGTVEGNDNPGTGIANAVVTLSGYSQFSTTTDQQGNFALDGVYIADNYTFTIQSPGYENYIQALDVVDNTSLGTITLTEALSLPRVVIAADYLTSMNLTWFEPSTTNNAVIAYDDGDNEDGYAGEPSEAVWIGNYFPVTEPVTVTSFDIYWARYATSVPQSHRLDIFDKNNELIYSSAPFTGPDNAWVNVPVTPMTLHGNYYVMVYWENTPVQSNYLGIDTVSATTPDNAYYHYEGGEFFKLSGLTSFYGTMLIHANVLTGDNAQQGWSVNGTSNGAGREITGYDVTFGPYADIANAGNWPLLNSSPLTETGYIDETWPPATPGRYIYGVKTYYTTGESEFSFSGIAVYDPSATNNLTIPGISLYPNPATSNLTINATAGSEVLLFNMQGQLLYNAAITGNSHTIDVSRFAKGTVLVVLRTSDSIAQERVILK